MFSKKFFPLFSILFVFLACSENKDVSQDYKDSTSKKQPYQTTIDTGRVEVTLSNGKEKQISFCRYAYFKLNDSSFVYEEKVNKKIIEELSYYFDEKERAKLSPKLNVEFFKEILRLYKEMYEENKFDDILWGVDEYFDIDNSYKEFVYLTRAAYDYSGGAHGNYLNNNYLFSKETGEQLFLADVINDFSKFKVLAEKNFRIQNEIPPKVSLEDYGFWFEKGFEPSQNFYFSEKGMEFVYNPYEIGPYALGQVTFTIPKKDILPFLKINIERTK